MNRTLLISILLWSTSCLQAETAHWGYQGPGGPEHWAELSPKFSACAGQNQSPIDLKGFIEAELPPIAFAYQPGTTEILNNGHTVQINYAPGSHLSIDGSNFELKQFHFHSPSENHIEGKSFPMEAHLVHADKNGNLVVVAVMFEEGAANPLLETAWKQMPTKAGDKKALAQKLAVDGILPGNRDYYRFNGSLTTPPCSEGVRWLVMKQPMSASREQIEAFAHVMLHANNRPLQPINARPVLK